MTHHLVSRKYAKAIMLPMAIGIAVFVFLALGHLEGRQASAIGCPFNFIYFTGHTPSNQYVDGVKVSGKIRHRGFVYPSDWAWSCVRGEVLSEAKSTIDQVSWEGWKYEDGDEVDNWGSSCIDCKKGDSRGSHSSWFIYGLGYEIQTDGRHYFRNGASTLWLHSTRTIQY